MTNEAEVIDSIEACRTCGVYYMTTSNFLRPLFATTVDQPDMMLIRIELATWKIEITEDDGLPQYVCTSCIHEFQKMFKFRRSCIEMQEQFRHFYNLRQENTANIKIKTEMADPEEEEEENMCDFIYVDDLSNDEYDGATPFNIPHAPIKEEVIEAAAVPVEVATEMISIAEAAISAATAIQQTAGNETFSSKSLVNGNMPEMVPGAPGAPAAPAAVRPIDTMSDETECKLCQHISPNELEHRQHMRRIHEVKDLECHICGKKFKNCTATRLKFHLKWHNLSKHIKCVQCGFYCSSRDTLNEHTRAVHSKIKCKKCGKMTLAKKMKSHLREHDLETRLQCDYCPEVFSVEKEREQHIWQMHSAEEVKLQDDLFVDPYTTTIGELDESNGELVYKLLCALCDQKFANRQQLELHVQHEHHSNIATAPAASSDSTQISEETQNYVQEELANITIFEDYDDDKEGYVQHSDVGGSALLHQEGIEPNSKFQGFHETQDNVVGSFLLNEDEEHNAAVMADDDQKLTTNSEMASSGISSMRFVNGDVLPFACAQCTQNFATIEQLRTHHGEHASGKSKSKPAFRCEICGKSFELKFSLNRHLIKHNKA